MIGRLVIAAGDGVCCSRWHCVQKSSYYHDVNCHQAVCSEQLTVDITTFTLTASFSALSTELLAVKQLKWIDVLITCW